MKNCKRCGVKTNREDYCFHCLLALDIEKATNGAISKGIIKETMPNQRHKPVRGRQYDLFR